MLVVAFIIFSFVSRSAVFSASFPAWYSCIRYSHGSASVILDSDNAIASPVLISPREEGMFGQVCLKRSIVDFPSTILFRSNFLWFFWKSCVWSSGNSSGLYLKCM